jgi:hypothetical protein
MRPRVKDEDGHMLGLGALPSFEAAIEEGGLLATRAVPRGA